MIDLILQHWQPIAAVAGFLLFWLWESIAPYFESQGRLRHAARNITVAVLNVLVTSLVFAAATVAASVYGEQTHLGLLFRVEVDNAVRLVAAWLALDCWTYWWHRANHLVPLLWRFHSVHHSDPAMDVSTATRFHIGEIAISSLLRLGVILLVGVPLGVIVVYEFMLLVSTQFHHSNIVLPVSADRLLRFVLVSPNMHKVHHSKIRAEMDSNYTSILSLWDRLFGTYQGKDDCRQTRFGVPGLEAVRFQTVAGLLRTPFSRKAAN